MTKPPGTKQRRLRFSIRQATLRCCLSFLTSLGDPLSGEAPGVGDSGIRLPPLPAFSSAGQEGKAEGREVLSLVPSFAWM